LYLHNLSTGKLEFVFAGDKEGRHVGDVYGHTSTITSCCFHGNQIYTGGNDAYVIAWDAKKMKRLFVGRGHKAAVTCIFADSNQLVSGSADTTIILWDKANGNVLRRVHGHSRGVHCILCSSSVGTSLEMISSSYETVFCWRRDRLSMV
jgi:WD40 repeat protein